MAGARGHWLSLQSLVGVLVLLACGAPSHGASARSLTRAAEPSVVEGAELLGHDPGGRQWRLSAERGVVAESEEAGHLWGVRGVLISQGRSMDLNCDEAIVSGGTEIRLRGQVRLGLDGYRIATEEAVYRRDTGMAHAEERVEMKGPALSVAGRGVVVNVAQRTVRVGQDVRAWVGDGTR